MSAGLIDGVNPADCPHEYNMLLPVGSGREGWQQCTRCGHRHPWPGPESVNTEYKRRMGDPHSMTGGTGWTGGPNE